MSKIDRTARAGQLLSFENEYREKGILVAGMDEVGRGPLAGNVVAACVILPSEPLIPWIDDSKKLSETRREKVFDEIMAIALYVGIGKCSPERIDSINILEATKEAMREAAKGVPASVFLIDAVKNLGLSGREVPIIKGDAQSYSIAAASIVAKVIRDREMREMDALYPGYEFARNKGYGTAAHIAALRRLGPTPIHRRSFISHFV